MEEIRIPDIRIPDDVDLSKFKSAYLDVSAFGEPTIHMRVVSVEEANLLKEIREVCSGLALSNRARAARYDKIVEILKEKADG